MAHICLFSKTLNSRGVRGSVCLAELCPQRPVNVQPSTGVQSHEGKADEVEKQGEAPSVEAKGPEHSGKASFVQVRGF